MQRLFSVVGFVLLSVLATFAAGYCFGRWPEATVELGQLVAACAAALAAWSALNISKKSLEIAKESSSAAERTTRAAESSSAAATQSAIAAIESSDAARQIAEATKRLAVNEDRKWLRTLSVNPVVTLVQTSAGSSPKYSVRLNNPASCIVVSARWRIYTRYLRGPSSYRLLELLTHGKYSSMSEPIVAGGTLTFDASVPFQLSSKELGRVPVAYRFPLVVRTMCAVCYAPGGPELPFEFSFMINVEKDLRAYFVQRDFNSLERLLYLVQERDRSLKEIFNQDVIYGPFKLPDVLNPE